MTPALKAELAALEARFAELDSAEQAYRAEHETLSAELAPILAKVRANEDAFEASKAEHAELAGKIDHLRKAVG